MISRRLGVLIGSQFALATLACGTSDDASATTATSTPSSTLSGPALSGTALPGPEQPGPSASAPAGPGPTGQPSTSEPGPAATTDGPEASPSAPGDPSDPSATPVPSASPSSTSPGSTDPGGADPGGGDGAGGQSGAPEPSTPSTAPSEPPTPSSATDERPWFSFFTTSMDGLLSLAPDPENGFGGDFGGLAGADEICATLAKNSNPSDGKTWRAFLSTSGYDGGERVDAIDRIGDGPWYDFQGRLFAASLDELIAAEGGRPPGDPQLVEMFTDEWGDPIRPNEQIDNHDTLTGSNSEGRLYDDGNGGEIATCRDWTSNTVSVMDAENPAPSGGGGGFGPGGGTRGIVPVGHSWPRSENNGREWIQDHTVNGCEPSVNIGLGAGAAADDYSVGGGGGYGAFYCFALGAVAPD